MQGRFDDLKGLKENVVMGRLIPAGTGFVGFKNLEIETADVGAV